MEAAHILIDNGGGGQSPDTIVVHAMGEIINDNGTAYYATEWLKKRGLSAHYLVTPTGTIIKCRDEKLIGYHAKNHNTNTIGIEFLVPGMYDLKKLKSMMLCSYVSENQYQAGLMLVQNIMSRNKISSVVQHSEIDPERKVDPGAGFPWRRLMKDIENI